MTCLPLQFSKKSIPTNIWLKEKMRSITFCNHHSSPTISSSVFGDHLWGKSKSLFCPPSGPCSLGSLVRTQHLCDERWFHYIWVFFHEGDYKEATEDGVSQFPSQIKELKATTGVCWWSQCVCVCVAGSFPGLLKVNLEGFEWRVFQS